MSTGINNARPIIGLIALLAVAMLAATACTSPSAASTNAPQPTINVSGHGEATGTPDIAYISLGIDVKAPDLDQAIAQANTAMSDVQAAMTAQGIAAEDMQTINFNVWVEDPYDERGQPTGQRIYHVQNTLRVKVRDIGKAGEVLGAGLEAGANTVQELSFGISDPAALQAEARTQAVTDAQARAQQLAEGLGVKLGGPVTVSESYMPTPIYVERAAAYDAMGASPAAVPVSTGQLTVTVDVNVSFAIEQ